MKEHFCPAEQSTITYQGECSWCGEREALAQTQEPVAVVSGYYGGQCVILPIDPARIFNSNTALYTAPPQRTWVGLTDKEVRDLWSWSATSEAEKTANTQQHAFARAIEAKLKERNNGV